MKIGYARVSTSEQNIELQTDALLQFGCEKIFTENASALKDRNILKTTLEHLRKGDTLVVWKLDRLGRTLKQLIELIEKLRTDNIGFISIQDNIDTSTSYGRLFFNIIASFAEFERDIIVERTKAGLIAARARGRIGGRKKGLSENAKKKAKAAKTLYEQYPRMPVTDICKTLGISKATLYKYLRFMDIDFDKKA